MCQQAVLSDVAKPSARHERRLKERGVLLDESMRYKVACYAAKVTLSALTSMFSNARAVMEWLTDCARIISDAGTRCIALQRLSRS